MFGAGWFFYLAALPVVVCTVVTGLLWLPSKSTGWFVRLDVGLAWFAALATLILVPTDVTTTLLGDQPAYLSTWWLASYWYGFVVQVLVLPVHMEFTRSGEFTIGARIAQSIRNNLIYYGLLLAVGLAGLLLLLMTGHLKASNVVGFCIASSNAYGLIAGIFLMGFGLVHVPKQLWKCADLHGEARRLEHQAGAQAERAMEAHRRLSVAVLTARKASVLFANHDPMRPYMDTVLSLANSVGPTFKPAPGAQVPDESELDYFDRSDLAGLRRLVKGTLKDYEREKALYLEGVEAYLHIERVLAQQEAAGGGLPEGAPLKDRLLWLWRCHLHYWSFRAAAVAATACSVGIAVAEATISGVLPNTSPVSWVLRRAAGHQFGTELLCLLCLAYPCACAYYAIYRLGQFSFYRLVPRHTDAYSLCYSALLMARFAPPLAFNFMAAIAMPVSSSSGPDVTDTVFYRIFGELMMRQPLIGWQFTTFAPAALLPYMLLLVLGAFNPLMRGMSRLFRRSSAKLTFEDDWAQDSLAAGGRRLLRLESENARNGLPLGLTIEPGGGGSSGGLAGGGAGGGAHVAEALLGVPIPGSSGSSEQAPWWRRVLGRGGAAASPGAAGSFGSSSRVRHSMEADEARSRLSRALGRGGGRGSGAGAGAGRGVEDLASPTVRLLAGEESSSDAEPLVGSLGRQGRRSGDRGGGGGGDIFSRIDEDRSERHGWRSSLGAAGSGGGRGPGAGTAAGGQQGGGGGGNRSPLHSVDVESVESSEDGQSRLTWLARFAGGRR